MDNPHGSTTLPWNSVGDRYRVERELGRGGMATVYLAEDAKYHRPVAIKVLKPEVASALGPSRFLREIEIASKLAHPHLLPLYDSGEADGLLYYVMPFVEGQTLRDLLKIKKQLPLDDALRIASDVADGLSYAHEHDIVHRDVKPENILLQADRAIVADFGLARAITKAAMEPLTSSGIVVGTPWYMSPEQGLAERDLDGRSDVYSLGCVLYEMLAGEPPFTGSNPRTIMARHAAERVPSLSVVRPDIPEEVEEAIERALAKSPAARFQTAKAFGQRLRELGRQRRRRWSRRKRRAAIVGVAAVAAAVAGIAALRLASGGGLAEEDWLLVADFEGPPEDPGLANSVRDLATAAFEQSRFVRTVPRRQLNEVMRRAGVAETTHVDAQLARQLATRSSLRAVLLGGVRRLGGDAYSLVLHVVSADDGAPLASAASTSTGAALVSTVQDLSREVRQELGERRSSIAATRPLRDVVTPSFEAFRKYSAAADRLVIHGDIPGSNRLLMEAIALDSAFASAWAVLGGNYLNARQPDSARIAFGKALSYPDRLSAAEAYRLKGDAAYVFDYDLPAAVKWYDLYLAEKPHSRSGRSVRALYQTALGQYDRALVDLEQGVAINPFGPELNQPTLLNLAAVLVVLGRQDEAQRVARDLSGQWADYLTIMLRTARSEWAAVDSVAARVVGGPTPPGVFRVNATTARASSLAARGAVRAADSALSAAANEARGSMARWYERARLLLALASGTPVRPRSDLVPRDSSPPAAMLRALWAAVAGDTAFAAGELARLRQLPTRQLASIGAGPLLIDAWIAAHANRWGDVVNRLGPLALAGEHEPSMLDRPDSFLLRWLVAVAYERLDKLDSAAVYFDLVLRPTRLPPGHVALRGLPYGFAHRRLAAIHERRGDAQAAVRHLDAVLAAFRTPDSVTQALVVDARSARARLQRRAERTCCALIAQGVEP